MQPVELKELRIGDKVKIFPQDEKLQEIISAFLAKGVEITSDTELKFVGVSHSSVSNILVSYNGRTTGGWLPRRFYFATPINKEEQRLKKIDYLWKKQQWYKDYVSTQV